MKTKLFRYAVSYSGEKPSIVVTSTYMGGYPGHHHIDDHEIDLPEVTEAMAREAITRHMEKTRQQRIAELEKELSKLRGVA